MPDVDQPNPSADEATSIEQSDSGSDESKRPPLQFKKRSEAIPLKPKRRKSKTRNVDNLDLLGDPKSPPGQSKDFFANDALVSNFRQKFSKPIIAIIGVMWFLGIVYLFKVALTKDKASPINNNSVVVADQEPATLEEAYSRLTNQLKVADELSELVHNRDALNRGARLKLKSLYAWNVLDLTNDQEDVEMSKRLVRATRQYIGNKDHEINVEARKGLMLLQVKEYFDSPDKQFWPEIAERFNELIESDDSNSADSENFLMLANAVAKNGLDEESLQLYESIAGAYAESKDDRLAAIAAKASEKIAARRPSDQVFASVTGSAETKPTASESAPDLAAGSDNRIPAVAIEQELAAEAIPAKVVDDSNVVVASAIEDENAESDVNAVRIADVVAPTDKMDLPEIAASSDASGESDPFGRVVDMKVETTEEFGAVVVTPSDNAPDRLATDGSMAKPITNEEKVVASLSPGAIEPAPEPDIETSRIEVTEAESERTPEIAKDVEVSGAAKNALDELESNIDDFFAAKDFPETQQKDLKNLGIAKIDEKNTEVVDEAMSVDAELKSETELAPKPVEQVVESELPPRKVEPQPELVARNVIRRPKAVTKTRNAKKISGVAKEKLASYQQRVRSELQAENVSASTLTAAIEFSDYLIENNSVASAKDLLAEVRDAVYLVSDSKQRSRIRERYYSAKKRLDYFGRPFVFNGLYDLDGKVSGLDDSNQVLKLVVFWSLESQVSVSLIEQIERIKEEFKSRRVKVVAVCETENSSSRKKLQTIAEANSSIEFLQLKSGDRASDLFSDRFPVRKFPYLLMLSAKNDVAGINVDPVFFDPIGR